MSPFIALYPADASRSMTTALIECGFRPVPIEDVSDAVDKEPPAGWAACVVEVGVDGGLALAVASKLREELGVPVLLGVDRPFTERLLDEDGFDDFFSTPVDLTELEVRLARLSSRLRDRDSGSVLRFKDLELNTATYQAMVAGEPRDLTFMEYELLRFFMENPQKVWSREQILAKVWGYDYFGGSRTVDVHVRRLRAKLGEERRSWIVTVRSVGYRFG